MRVQRRVEPTGDGFCFACRARDGIVTCPDCGGSGALARGGYNAKGNPVNLTRILNSKWTAHEATFGWRHFVVLSRRREGATHYLEMKSTCDESVRFWVAAANLKDRARWSCGWLEKAEMRAVAAAGDAPPGGRCRACSGSGECRCPACNAPGGILQLR